MSRKLQPVVNMNYYWVDRAMKWGDEFVRHRLAHPELAPRSQAVAGDGIEKDPYKQGCAKLCEAAVAICTGGHPAQCNWSMTPDDGCDVYYKPHTQVDGLRIDVKGTKWASHCLIWPIYKNAIFDDIKSDVLLLARCDPPRVLLSGWVSKAYFGNNHQTAGEHHFLKPGTWYLEEGELWDLKDLLPNTPPLRWAPLITEWPSSDAPSTEKPSKPLAGDAASTATSG